MSKFTVFGGRGFIGSEFVKKIESQGCDVFIPERNDNSIYEIDLGTVIYCAGYGDCQKDPFNVLHANVTLLSSLLEKAVFDKLVYISSTRVYMNQNESFENGNLTICNDDNRKLFNLTKLVSEELCLKSGRNCLIVRPSNVYGLAIDSPLFLPSIVRDAISKQIVNMYVTPMYSKDYIYVEDLVTATIELIDIDIKGTINIASGVNTTAKDIADCLIQYTSCKVNWLVNKDIDYFSPIDISKLSKNIEYNPSTLISNLHKMIIDFQTYFKSDYNSLTETVKLFPIPQGVEI